MAPLDGPWVVSHPALALGRLVLLYITSKMTFPFSPHSPFFMIPPFYIRLPDLHSQLPPSDLLLYGCVSFARRPRAHRLLSSSHSVTFVPCLGRCWPFSLAARSVAGGVVFTFFPLFLPLALTTLVEYLYIKARPPASSGRRRTIQAI